MSIGTAPAVSVVMPVYNCAAYLPEALACLEAQEMGDFEAIMVDDGSTDGSADVARDFAARDPRLRYVRQENAGAGPARNAGLALARGEWVIFLDGDDLFEPTLLSALVATARAHDADVVACEWDAFDSATGAKVLEYRRPADVREGENVRVAHERTLFQVADDVTWTKLYRRGFLISSGIEFQNLPAANDVYHSNIALYHAERAYVVRQALVHYRVAGGGSIRDAADTSRDLCAIDALEAVRDELLRTGATPELLSSLKVKVLAAGEGVVANVARHGGSVPEALRQLDERLAWRDVTLDEVFSRLPRKSAMRKALILSMTDEGLARTYADGAADRYLGGLPASGAMRAS